LTVGDTTGTTCNLSKLLYVTRDALSGRGSNLSLCASAYQRIISNNPTHMMNRETVQVEKRGFDGVLCKLTVAGTLIYHHQGCLPRRRELK